MLIKTAVLSDIHGNLPALEAVLADVNREGCSRLFFLGDIVNGIDPHGCVSLLHAWGQFKGRELYCIQGNAEAYTFTPHLESLPRKEERENQELIRLITWFREHLTPDDLDWVGGFPAVLLLDGVCLAHDSPIDRFFPERWHIPGLADGYQEWFYHGLGIKKTLDGAPLAELLAWMDSGGITSVFCGHTHEPFVRREGERLICNAGAVGFPLDGDPRSSWVLVDGEVTIRRVAYDIDRALRMMDDNDYPTLKEPAMRRAYKKMFQTGIHWRAHLR
ncbi:MAG: metallophosphoesterase family protein [Saprospiraceae bacterium]|nr:metallophosphoesterase family protein [Saprospiraceae bacterium]